MAKNNSELITIIIAVVILAGVGWYGYSQYNKLTEIKDKLGNADVALLSLEKTRGQVAKDYQNSKKDYVVDVTSNQEKIAAIFPSTEDITGLTRMFDDFAFKNHFRNNPFFITQLSFSEPQDDGNANYMLLPINMSVETSQQNLLKFFEFVKDSGSLGNGIPLLATNGVTIQVNDEELSNRVQLTLNAYIQK